MKNRHGTVIYVGKAIVLAHRVKSYFQKSADVSPKTRSLVEQIASIDTVVTGSELEALLLENNLIKKYRPKYNVILRDDKSYPMLRLPIGEDFPRLEIVRRVRQGDKALYFGPYIPSGGLYEMLRVLRTLFPLPNCNIVIDGKADRPCIEFEIKRCLAPCTGNQSKEAYQEMIQSVILFLEGKDRLLLTQLTEKMNRHAEELHFEEAARIRDQIAKIKRALEHQRIISSQREDQDIVALFRASDDTLSVAVLFVRGGKVLGKKEFFFEAMTDLTDEEVVSHFLSQFYDKDRIIPKRVVLPLKLSDQSVLQQWLAEKRGEPVALLSPTRGARRRLIDLAIDNAKSALESRHQTSQKAEATLAELQSLLHLSQYPYRIEGYDISNIMGTSAVGSMVVFEGGVAKKENYRHFKIRTVEGANDFAMMAEILARRVAPATADGQLPLGAVEEPTSLHPKAVNRPQAPLPNLILIDGGKGQLSAVREVLEAAGMGTIDLIGLAKEREYHPEQVYLPDLSLPIDLPEKSLATHLLMQVRDEAHRFAITHHRKVRSQKMLQSPLEEIAGIGKKRRLALLRHFGSISKIRDAPLKEIEKVPTFNKKVARQLFDAIHSS